MITLNLKDIVKHNRKLTFSVIMHRGKVNQGNNVQLKAKESVEQQKVQIEASVLEQSD